MPGQAFIHSYSSSTSFWHPTICSTLNHHSKKKEMNICKQLFRDSSYSEKNRPIVSQSLFSASSSRCPSTNCSRTRRCLTATRIPCHEDSDRSLANQKNQNNISNHYSNSYGSCLFLYQSLNRLKELHFCLLYYGPSTQIS